MAYQIEWQGRVVYTRLSGSVTVSELAGAVTEIAAAPAFDQQRFHVVDYTDATLPPLDTSVFDAIVPVVGATSMNPYISALVVPDNEQTRAFAAFCAPLLKGMRSVRFFRDRAQADAWIGEQSMSGGGITL